MTWFNKLSTITLVTTVSLSLSACGAVGANDEAATNSPDVGDSVLENQVAENQAGENSVVENRRRNSQEAQGAQQDSFIEHVVQAKKQPIQIPAGTTLTLQLASTLSSHETAVGTSFSGTVTQEVSVNGKLAVPSGSAVRGHVTEAHAAEKIGGRAILAVSFDEIEIPGNASVAIAASLTQAGKKQVAKDAAIIGGSTLGGAILGEAIDEGKGTTVGAIVGAVGGTIGALKTKGKPLVLPAGTALTIVLDSPVTVDPQS